MESSKNIYYYLIIGAIVISVGLVILYFFGIKPSDIARTINIGKEKPQVVEETLVIPDTQKITGTEGRTSLPGSIAVPLVPKSEAEKVVVSRAVLTVKGSYDKVKPEAEAWSKDAKLVFIKSLGAVTLEGKSSQWQLVFSSMTKPGEGYEIIVQSDQVVSKKEIESKTTGGNVPNSLKDSDYAIKTLQELPQFSDATISSISLYYNNDGKVWRYALATSRGTTSTSAE